MTVPVPEPDTATEIVNYREWVDCPTCSGRGQLHIRRELDNRIIGFEECWTCNGTGEKR